MKQSGWDVLLFAKDFTFYTSLSVPEVKESLLAMDVGKRRRGYLIETNRAVDVRPLKGGGLHFNVHVNQRTIINRPRSVRLAAEGMVETDKHITVVFGHTMLGKEVFIPIVLNTWLVIIILLVAWQLQDTPVFPLHPLFQVGLVCFILWRWRNIFRDRNQLIHDIGVAVETRKVKEK